MPVPRRLARSVRGWLNIVVLSATIVPALVWLGSVSFGSIGDMPLGAILGAAALYLTAHLLRAVRLALLGVRLTRISGRTTALLHFVTSPSGLVLPFKTGELLRLHQLWQLSDDFAAAVLVVLSERFFDGLMVMCLLGISFRTGMSLDGGAWLVFVATSLAVILAVIVLVLGPGTLTALQLYIIRHYHHRLPVQALGRIDVMRRQTTDGARLLRERGGVLALLSLAIWTIEIAAACQIATAHRSAGSWGEHMLAGIHLAVDSIFMRRTDGSDEAALAWAITTISVLTLVWPAALWRYLRRVPFEPQRVKALQKETVQNETIHGRHSRRS